MATIYCRSTDGDDGSDGSTWALAKATLAAAVTAAGDGGLVYVSHQHAEAPAAAVTLSAGTASAPVTILCVNDGAEPPTALASTATLTWAGATSYNCNFEKFIYMYGISFVLNNYSASAFNFLYAGDAGAMFDTCNFTLGSGSSGKVNIGYIASSSYSFNYRFRNCKLKFGHTSQGILSRGGVIFEGNAVAFVDSAGTIPTVLFLTTATRSNFPTTLEGVDLSTLSTYLISGTNENLRIEMKNCKLHSSLVMLNAAIDAPGTILKVHNCDSGDTNYRFGEYSYQGSIIQATNCNLNADYSMKMISLATGPVYTIPLISPPIAKWNTTTGSALKATVEIISTATLKDDEIWLEVEYLGTSGFPMSSFANDRHEHHIVSLVSGTGNGSNQDSSTAAWTEDLSGEVKQKLVVTSFTPQEAGYVIGRVYLAKANQTVYVDPKLTIEAA